MKVYYLDDKEGDQRDPHDSGVAVSAAQLENIGVLGYHFDDIAGVDKLAEQRHYVNRDVITISPEAMGGQDVYEGKIRTFFTEHLHEDEEIRYIVDGDGYFDVRDKQDRWIRAHMSKGDLLILPAGIYHRFTTAGSNYIKAMRLFQQEPKWVPHNRPCDDNAFRVQYVNGIAT